MAAPGVLADPLFVAVVPDAGAGVEAFAVWSSGGNGGPSASTVQQWSVTDGEGTFVLPELGPGVHWFANDVDAWRSFAMPEARPFTGPRLADSGDELELVGPGGVLDAFAWGRGATAHMQGSVAYRSEGLVYRRTPDPATQATPWTDTDHADDWKGPRVHRIGQSEIEPVRLEAERLTLYASPDSSHDVLTTLLAGARERVALHVYGLRSASLAEAVAAAAARGALVDVLVTKSPVGLTSEGRHETAWALQRITDAGGHAWLAGNGRYDFHHLKVLVVDDAVAIQSENWVPSGVPEDPTWGNRGWGAVVHGDAAADWFASWMREDRAAWDVEALDLHDFDPHYREPVRLPPRAGTLRPVASLEVPGPVEVEPFVSPDHTGDPRNDPVAQVVSAASRRLLVQQLDLSLEASNALGWHARDVLVEEVTAAAGRGVPVRVQAAEPFAADDEGNAEALAWLETVTGGKVATRQGAATAIATLHNKGLVADDAVVVGSMNGNHHSRSENREAGIILHSAAAADYFAGLFASDWGRGGAWASYAPAPAPSLLVSVLLGALWCIRRRGSSWASS